MFVCYFQATLPTIPIHHPDPILEDLLTDHPLSIVRQSYNNNSSLMSPLASGLNQAIERHFPDSDKIGPDQTTIIDPAAITTFLTIAQLSGGKAKNYPLVAIQVLHQKMMTNSLTMKVTTPLTTSVRSQ